MPSTFIFLHTGPDAEVPTAFVRSIRATNPNARIIHCTDNSTPQIDGTDERRVFDGDIKNLMTFRLACFANLAHPSPALYLDTDMLCARPIDPQAILGDADVAVCQREFDCDAPFNTNFRNLDWSEYAGKTLAQVYPYIACATITRDATFWKSCLENLNALPEKFHFWYGDQEAIRNVINSKKYKNTFLSESIYGCLPERAKEAKSPPAIFHFKGPARKSLMLDWARRLNFLAAS